MSAVACPDDEDLCAAEGSGGGGPVNWTPSGRPSQGQQLPTAQKDLSLFHSLERIFWPGFQCELKSLRGKDQALVHCGQFCHSCKSALQGF